MVVICILHIIFIAALVFLLIDLLSSIDYFVNVVHDSYISEAAMSAKATEIANNSKTNDGSGDIDVINASQQNINTGERIKTTRLRGKRDTLTTELESIKAEIKQARDNLEVIQRSSEELEKLFEALGGQYKSLLFLSKLEPIPGATYTIRQFIDELKQLMETEGDDPVSIFLEVKTAMGNSNSFELFAKSILIKLNSLHPLLNNYEDFFDQYNIQP